MTIFTVGHSTRSHDELVSILESASVRTLADIRRFPGSRRHPQFSREALETSLPAVGVDYIHVPELGGRRTPLPDTEHLGLRNASFRAYADHMATAEFLHGIDRLFGTTPSVCVMCAEAVPWRCHRNLLADWLVLHGHEVVHLLAEGSERPHTPLREARLEDGVVVYRPFPAAQASLPFGESDDR